MPVQLRHPVGRPLQEIARAVGVGQHDAQVAVVVLLPVGQHPVGRLGQLAVVVGERGVDHRQLVRVGADRLHLAAHGDQAVRGAEEGRAQALDHRLHAPVLPQEAVAPARAEVGDADAGQQLEAADLLPHARHGPRVQHLQLELAEPLGDGAAVQLHQHGERRDLPHGGLDPRPLEGQLVLVAAALQVVGRKAEALEPGDEVGREHLPLAVEHVAAQPGRFAARLSDSVRMWSSCSFSSPMSIELGELDGGGAVDDAEGDPRVAVAAEDRLRHQQLVEVRVEHRADDRVDLPGVIVDAGGDVGHGRVGPCCRSPEFLALRRCYAADKGLAQRSGQDLAAMPGARQPERGRASARGRRRLAMSKGPGANAGADSQLPWMPGP